MVFAVPYVILLLILTWFILIKLFPITKKNITINFNSVFLKNTEAKIVYGTFILTIFLWLFGEPLIGINAPTVSLIPLVIFCATGVLTPHDLKSVSWDVLWLVSGGIALGLALDKTGLSTNIIKSIPFESLSPIVILVIASILGLIMSTFISNTATANLILPIMLVLGINIENSESIGGPMGLVVACTISCSLAMTMPISTPPNALAYSTGLIKSHHLGKVGAIVGIIGLIMNYIMVAHLNFLGFF